MKILKKKEKAPGLISSSDLKTPKYKLIYACMVAFMAVMVLIVVIPPREFFLRLIVRFFHVVRSATYRVPQVHIARRSRISRTAGTYRVPQAHFYFPR